MSAPLQTRIWIKEQIPSFQKKLITDRISQSAGPSIALSMFNAKNKHKHNTNFTKCRL